MSSSRHYYGPSSRKGLGVTRSFLYRRSLWEANEIDPERQFKHARLPRYDTLSIPFFSGPLIFSSQEPEAERMVCEELSKRGYNGLVEVRLVSRGNINYLRGKPVVLLKPKKVPKRK